jgi:FixJ family two-component response regulator
MSDRSIRVAIVDDDASVRKALARLLSAYSFEITTYGSAGDFLKSVGTGVPQCLVLDLHMPDATGLDLQRHLQRAGIRIPTIVITAYDEPGVRERCYTEGAAAFLVKPLNDAILIGAINAATGRAGTAGEVGSQRPGIDNVSVPKQ